MYLGIKVDLRFAPTYQHKCISPTFFLELVKYFQFFSKASILNSKNRFLQCIDFFHRVLSRVQGEGFLYLDTFQGSREAFIFEWNFKLGKGFLYLGLPLSDISFFKTKSRIEDVVETPKK